MISRYLSARAMLTIGLVSLVTSAFLLVSFLGFLPDRSLLKRDARLSISELIAASSMSSLANGNTSATEALMTFVVNRNDDLKSAAIRRSNGKIVAQSGAHVSGWNGDLGAASTDTDIVVPLYSGGSKWGQVELSFESIGTTGWYGFLLDDQIKFAVTLGVVCFVGFYLFLGRMLTHLDPSRAVPDRVRSALDTLAESLLLLDNKSQIVLANQSFARLVGKSPASLLGRPSSSLKWLDRQGHLLTIENLPWTMALSQGELQRNVPIAIVDSENRKRSFLANCAPIAGSEQTINGVLISMDDVTELEEKEIQLNLARQKADSANQAKTDFLANVSHEIRTPMNSVLGFTELMRRNISRSAAENSQYLDTISRNGNHLLALINDILDLSKVESGELEIEQIETSPHVVALEVIEILSFKADEKGIDLRFEAIGDVPETICADPAKIRQILTNLIGNAIKFTESGEIVVKEMLVNKSDRDLIELNIRDTGIGIGADKLRTIFEPFSQAESSTTRRFGGTGLGLTISRKFARAMGGDITVTSKMGSGSEFIVRIPVNLDADALSTISAQQAMVRTPATQGPPTTSWQFSGQRILVVDDSPENRELVRVVLEQAGLVVELATNGQEGCDAALNAPFDLILMDMQMPVLDGYSATAKLRKAGLKTTIYAVTANALTGFEKEIHDCGCDGFLTKPIDIDKMLATLADMLGAHEIEIDTSVVATPTVGSTVSDNAMREGQPPIESRLAGNQRLSGIIASFVERLPSQVTRMQRSIDAKDHEALSQLAHWLKGSAGSVGFDDFTQPAKLLEKAAQASNWDVIPRHYDTIKSLASQIIAPVAHGSANADQLSEQPHDNELQS